MCRFANLAILPTHLRRVGSYAVLSSTVPVCDRYRVFVPSVNEVRRLGIGAHAHAVLTGRHDRILTGGQEVGSSNLPSPTEKEQIRAGARAPEKSVDPFRA
jgi:hypothetical protein